MARFVLERSRTIDADPATLRPLIENLRSWQRWSPWEGLDPDLEREYSGPASGPGSRYAWNGNRKAGRGTITVTGSAPEEITLVVEFLKPFRARNEVTFELLPDGTGTKVLWRMGGTRNAMMSLMGRLFVDGAIAQDLERGLEALEAAARG